jgi:hypothetical protein
VREIMTRINQKKSSPTTTEDIRTESYEQMKSLLSDDGLLEIEENNNELTIFIKNKPYAHMKMQDEKLIVQFIKPKDLTGLDKNLSYYSELNNPAGWLEFRTFADNNFEDQLQAELGSFIGQILCELNMQN